MAEAPLVAWCVVFSARRMDPAPCRWLRWLHPAFQHAFACRELAPEATLVVNQVGAAMQVQVAPMPVDAFIRGLAGDGGRIVLLDIRPAPGAVPFLRGPMTCVETVKALLGIRAWWIITPRQLYRRLRADGAKVVYPIPDNGG